MRQPGPDDLVTGDLDTDEFPLQTRLLDLSQRGLADEVVSLVEVNEPPQTGFVRVVVPVDVRWIVQDPGLDAAGLGRTRGAKVQRVPGRPRAVPQNGSAHSIAQID